MDELKRLVQKAHKAVQMVEALEGKRDISLRRAVNRISLGGGGKHTGNNNRWITRKEKRVYVDERGKKVRNWKEKMEYDRLRDEYARLPSACGKVGLDRNPPYKKTDILARNRKIRELIKACKRRLREAKENAARRVRELVASGNKEEAIRIAIENNLPLSVLG